MKYFFSLFVLLAISSEIIIGTEVAADHQLANSFEKRPLNKFNPFYDDNNEGIIILSAYRRRGGRVRGKYKKVIAVSSTEPAKTTTSTTTESVVKVTTEEPVIVIKETKTVPVDRRNQLAIEDRQNALWLARKRVTRPPKAVQPKKVVKVNVVDEEEYSVRRARYLFTQRLG